jgi:hypothetical protein
MVCREGNPLCTIPINTMPESFPSGERHRLPKQSVVNSKLPKQMVSSRVNPMPVKLLSLVIMVNYSSTLLTLCNTCFDE